jgi:hypothetical protein
MPTNELTVLEARLARALHRVESEPPFSPDWDAAMGEVDDLELQIAELTRRAPADAQLAGTAASA